MRPTMRIPPLPRPLPSRVTLTGRYAALEPLDAPRHGRELFAASFAPGAEARFRYLAATPDPDAFATWLADATVTADPLYFAVIDLASGRCEGRQALLRIAPEHGVAEVGHILWGPAIGRTRVATEALYLTARYVFDVLGYRRFEWKCDAENSASRRAALRFGFTHEGTFRQHMVTKGRSRDTAWFAMIDADWPALAAAFEAWLAPANFTADGRQLTALGAAWRPPADG